LQSGRTGEGAEIAHNGEQKNTRSKHKETDGKASFDGRLGLRRISLRKDNWTVQACKEARWFS